jgi:hypothetical protein
MKKALNVQIFSSMKNHALKQNAEIINFDSITKRRDIPISGRKRAETALWKAVIMQSVLDVMSNSGRASDILAKKIALEWLDKKNKNFIVVCGYADLDPDWVLKKVFFALENPRMWRRECDLKKRVKKQDEK